MISVRLAENEHLALLNKYTVMAETAAVVQACIPAETSSKLHLLAGRELSPWYLARLISSPHTDRIASTG